MSDILLSNEVSINLFVELFLYILLFVALLYTLSIVKGYKKGDTTSHQYFLEKRSYLVITILNVSLVIKILLLPFFTYTLDKLSTIIPGAMCAAGVIKANSYGEPTLILKIIIIMLILLWVRLNKEDEMAKNHPYFMQKLYFFIFIFMLISIEIILEVLYLTNISTLSPVLCCSTIYKTLQDQNPIPFGLSISVVLFLFYSLYGLILLIAHAKKRVMLFVLSLIYVYVAYYGVVYFFSSYIYELPTHKCPFCMLQSDYYYIGYFIFSSLFIATYYSLSMSIFNFSKDNFSKIVMFYTFFIFISSLHFVFYFLKNGVLL